MKENLSISIDAKEIRTKYLNNCSVTTFWRLRKRIDTFPKAIRVGGLVFWDRAEIEIWYNQIKITGGTNA